MQHPGQVDVVDVVAGAADEPVVLHAPDAVADPADLFGLARHASGSFSRVAVAGSVDAAAAWIAFTMFM